MQSTAATNPRPYSVFIEGIFAGYLPEDDYLRLRKEVYSDPWTYASQAICTIGTVVSEYLKLLVAYPLVILVLLGIIGWLEPQSAIELLASIRQASDAELVSAAQSAFKTYAAFALMLLLVHAGISAVSRGGPPYGIRNQFADKFAYSIKNHMGLACAGAVSVNQIYLSHKN